MAQFKKLSFVLTILLFQNILHTSARAFEDDWSESEETESSPEDSKPEQPGAGRSLDTSSSDHQHHDVKQIQTNETRQGTSGSNFANFNESCSSHSGKTCNPYTNIVCDPNQICKCHSNHIYIGSQEKCHQIVTKVGERCEFHDQCHNGQSGFLSHCDRVKGTCECYDTELGGKRPVAPYLGQCVLRKTRGEPCDKDAECQSTMGHNSYCAPGDPSAPPTWTNSTEFCQCQKKYVWDNRLQECLKIADNGLDSECKSDIQCTTAMGLVSRCGELSRKCECYDAANPGEKNAYFYKQTGKCYETKFWNSTCNDSAECKASISSMAECLPKENLSMQMVCQCPAGKRCPLDADGGGAMAIGANMVNIVVLTSFVVYRFFRV